MNEFTLVDNKEHTYHKMGLQSTLSFEAIEQAILERIKKHYGTKLKREIDDAESKEISLNLLGFAKAIYGIES